MTEMPEVEILVRGLREAVVGRTLERMEVLLPAAVRFPPVPEFAARQAGCVVTSAERRVVAGLGNRDADESLWLAGIDPQRPAASLSDEELARLHRAIVDNLNAGIDLRGTQRDLFGNKGRAKHRRHIFERTGLPCPRCGTLIAQARVGGRRKHYCPGCQR